MANSKKKLSIYVLALFVLCTSSSLFSKNDVESIVNKDINSHYLLFSAKKQYEDKKFVQAIDTYQKILEHQLVDSVYVFRELAFSYAEIDDADQASLYIEKYIMSSLDVSFIGHSYFEQISNSESYQKLLKKYMRKVDLWSIFCFYVGFIGGFIALVLNLGKRSNKIANLLMSLFVLLHSFFIIHLGLYFMNYEYYLPHTLYMSTSFSFLYGPLIYFYFKRVTTNYVFKLSDLLHFVPTVLLVVLLYPIYTLSPEEKLRMMLHKERPYMALISISKLISLLVYGALVFKMYVSSVRRNTFFSRIVSIWQRNIVIFCSVYIISYAIYSILIIQYMHNGFLFYLQVVSMALLVLYVSYTAFVQPSIFGKLKMEADTSIHELDKYKKSGLTQSLSLELKEKLLYLLDTEKIYKQNDITLQNIAELLDTTRHNASQIINEHFGLNFFELINKYRIDEAKELLRREKDKNFTIINVAYEVGFNNKVTFNKSFKKYNQITPSEYIKSFLA